MDVYKQPIQEQQQTDHTIYKRIASHEFLVEEPPQEVKMYQCFLNYDEYSHNTRLNGLDVCHLNLDVVFANSLAHDNICMSVFLEPKSPPALLRFQVLWHL